MLDERPVTRVAIPSGSENCHSESGHCSMDVPDLEVVPSLDTNSFVGEKCGSLDVGYVVPGFWVSMKRVDIVV